ncbi:MAG: ABC transporter permease [Armatimonadetes bacterium]|nr:ABC transporter permease [Armatimonadota bacterium]
MIGYIARRLGQAIPTLLVVLLVGKALLHVSGDPTDILLPPEATAEQRVAFRRQHGLDRPFAIQYARYVLGAFSGDLGQSLSFNEPALQIVIGHLPATLKLTAAAIAIGMAVALPVGMAAAVKRRSLMNSLGSIVVLLGQAVPTFWLGMMLILLFAVRLGWLPASGRGGPQHFVLPSVCLSFWVASLFMRLTRSSMLEVLSQDYVRTARAKGLLEWAVVTRHAFRNALLPLVTVVGLQFGALLGGALVTEFVFAWPGIGSLLMAAVETRDYALVLAIIMVVASGIIVINLLVDLLYGWIDPRIRVA